MEKEKVNKKDYEDIYDCIVSDQVPPKITAEYLEDINFYKYYIKRRALGGLWKGIMTDREIRKIKFSQINLSLPASDKLKTMSKNFRYGSKNLKRGKVVEAMAWQYNIIKNTDRAIIFKDGKFEVIEK